MEANKSNIFKQTQISNLPVQTILAQNYHHQDEAFFVCDLGEIVRQYKKWNSHLPRIKPFYGTMYITKAIKCNPDKMVLKTLAACGTGFDCASKGEISQILSTCPNSEIIYANPCKQASFISYAYESEIYRMTFDNADELFKIKLYCPNAKAILRILTDDSKSACRFGAKFGARLDIIPSLLLLAKELNVDVIGISFHVGSGCFDASGFTDAVKLSRKVFDIGLAYGFDFTLLDIGGGFPGNTPQGLKFEDIARVLGPTVDELFPPRVKVIAEPGRYFVTSAFTLAVNIIARRVSSRDVSNGSNIHRDVSTTHRGDVSNGSNIHRDVSTTHRGDVSTCSNVHPSFVYYLSEGIYGAFNNILFDDAAKVTLKPLQSNVPKILKSDIIHSAALHSADHSADNHSVTSNSDTVFNDPSNLFHSAVLGPTFSHMDVIFKDLLLPQLQIGDWIVSERMGAYTSSAATVFGGADKCRVVYTNTEILY
jgi:ornithine decarboxylase